MRRNVLKSHTAPKQHIAQILGPMNTMVGKHLAAVKALVDSVQFLRVPDDNR